jgi:hypothetical protein
MVLAGDLTHARTTQQNYKQPPRSKITSVHREKNIMSRRWYAPLIMLLVAGWTGVALAADDAAADRAQRDQQALEQKLTRFGYTPGAVVDDIQGYKLNGWNYLDRRHVMIHTGPSERYLVTLMVSCHDLSTAENIGFSTTATKLSKFDKLVVRGSGGMKQECPITELRKLTKIEKKAAQ